MSAPTLNQVGVRHSDVIDHVSRAARKQKEGGVQFDAMALGQALRDELPLIAGQVSDDSFAALVSVCASLVNRASDEIIATAKARTLVAKAQADLAQSTLSDFFNKWAGK